MKPTVRAGYPTTQVTFWFDFSLLFGLDCLLLVPLRITLQLRKYVIRYFCSTN